ncbi:MAG: diguanylate cyclase [Nitrospirae bacterium]|nr:diguanylate cyclase [Nitrospirota bacterium]
MHKNYEFFDADTLSIIQNSISEITDFTFSVYDNNGVLLIPAKGEDKLTTQIRSYIREEFDKFVHEGIKKAILRKDPFFHKGPFNEFHLFISASVNTTKFIFLSNAFYTTKSEFKELLIKDGGRIGISPSYPEPWLEAVKIKDLSEVQKIASHIKTLFETFLKCVYEKNINYKNYRWAKTLIDVAFSIQMPATEDEVYSLTVDAILFLFNTDTASIMVKEKNIFRTVLSSGRQRKLLMSASLEDYDNIISRLIEVSKPLYVDDVVKIQRFGLPENITSLHIFPLSHNKITYGLLVIYNSVISPNESKTIMGFCKLISLILKNLYLQNAFGQCVDNIEVLNIAVSKLTSQLHNPEALHEAILDIATNLFKAEKGSLMLPENNTLIIKAVKGINKWLVQDVRVKIGERIAGKVFKDGSPLFSNEIEKLGLPHIRPGYHYKTGSFMSVPIKFGSETIGVINVADRTTGEEFTEKDLTLINHFATYASIALKISNYYNLMEQMKELSITDPLTGLFNRRFLKERFIEEIHRSERYDSIFSLAIFDIDDFKLFNDTEGHLAGDSVLKDLASIARRCIRINDILSRFGGEEFAVLMPQTNKEEAFLVAERIRKSIKEYSMHKWKKFPHPSITVSTGIASFPINGRTIDELIEHADIALYKAKSLGKDRTVIYST